MTLLSRAALALAAVWLALAPAAAKDAYNPSLRNKYPSPNLLAPEADRIILHGEDSSGDASGFSARRPESGATMRTFRQKLRDLPVTPQDMGAVADGTASVDAAMGKVLAVQHRIFFPPGDYRFSASQTWPANRVYEFADGARLLPDSGVTIGIYGQVIAPKRQIFAGAGSVVGMKENYPEWWGAGNTYQVSPNRNDAPAINAAFASAAKSVDAAGIGLTKTRPTVYLSGFYYACTPVDMYPTGGVPIEVVGPGSLPQAGGLGSCTGFVGNALFNVHGIPFRNPDGSPTTNFLGSDFVIRDLALTNNSAAGFAPPIGLNFVPEGPRYYLNASNLGPNKIENVSVSDFPTGVKIQNARHLAFDALSVWGNADDPAKKTTTGVLITSNNVTDGTMFTGDMEFRDLTVEVCKTGQNRFLNNAPCLGTTGVVIEANGGNLEMKGFRFDARFYHGNRRVYLHATNGAVIGDIWFRAGTQWDGWSCGALFVAAEGSGPNSGNNNIVQSSLIDNVHVEGNYFRGVNPGCRAIELVGLNKGRVESIFVNGNWFANIFDTILATYSQPSLDFDHVTGI